PLSFGQRRLWFLNRLGGGGGAYHIPLAVRLVGVVDVGALALAVSDVVGRHEVLRTVFPVVGGEPVQVVLPVKGLGSLVSVVEVSGGGLGDVLVGEVVRGFDLTVDVPVRVSLFVVSPVECVLLFVLHHVAGDGWSMGPLARDFEVAYRARCGGGVPGWVGLPVQYVDYALWQRELLGERFDSGSRLSRGLGFWLGELAGLPEELGLPVDRVRPVVASQGGGVVDVVVGGGLHGRLVGLAREFRVTVFMVLHAVVVGLLWRLGVGSDVVVGSPVAGRSDVLLDGLVGFFVNSLVLRTRVVGDPSFGELLGRVREGDLAAFGHQDVPFELLVEVLNPVRSTGRHPLFQVMLALQPEVPSTLDLPGL
ncbi:non-ribosomal peptide synthetase, partial [Micromonospora sp. CPCC 205371]|nr:non-ribosomal peptide synthetase [Micromonospora sp. CPCC 205371]